MHWRDHVEVDERRSPGRPPNSIAREAVELARGVLERCGLELRSLYRGKWTIQRKGKWHLLSQIFADTSSDLRHHLEDSLMDSPLAEKS